jgi:hypothetical protein
MELRQGITTVVLDRLSPLAGFEAIIYARFQVITEVCKALCSAYWRQKRARFARKHVC